MRNWLGKLKSLFSNPRFLALLILIVTAGALKVFLWLIYTKDQPNFVPEETREDIRGSIKEGIARPLEKSLPVIGKPMLESAFIKSSEKSGNTENWQTYKNEELGIELKYPEGWVVSEAAIGLKIFDSKYKNIEAEIPLILVEVFDNKNGLTADEWRRINYSNLIGDQKPSEVLGFNEMKFITISGESGAQFTWENLGVIKSTLLPWKDNKILHISGSNLGRLGDMEKIYDEVLQSLHN